MNRKLQFTLTFVLVFAMGLISNAQSVEISDKNQFVDCGNKESLRTFTNNQMTIEAWVYATAFKDNVWEGCIVNKEQGAWLGPGGDNGYMIRVGKNGCVNFNIGDSTEGMGWQEITTDENTLSLNTWQYVAGVYDGSAMSIYVDGIKVLSEDKTFKIGVGDSIPLFIGASWMYKDRNFLGKIDEVRIWNKALNDAEIYGNYSKELAQTDNVAGLIAYYKLNEGTGATVKDQTGNNPAVFGGSADSTQFFPAWATDQAPITAAEDWTSSVENEMYQLGECYPNPAINNAIVPFELKQESTISIDLYDVLGKNVKMLMNESKSAGTHEARFNVEDLNSGLYFVKLSVDGKGVSTSKLYVK